jgi:hypothetical protein
MSSEGHHLSPKLAEVLAPLDDVASDASIEGMIAVERLPLAELDRQLASLMEASGGGMVYGTAAAAAAAAAAAEAATVDAEASANTTETASSGPLHQDQQEFIASIASRGASLVDMSNNSTQHSLSAAPDEEAVPPPNRTIRALLHQTGPSAARAAPDEGRVIAAVIGGRHHASAAHASVVVGSAGVSLAQNAAALGTGSFVSLPVSGEAGGMYSHSVAIASTVSRVASWRTQGLISSILFILLAAGAIVAGVLVFVNRSHPRPMASRLSTEATPGSTPGAEIWKTSKARQTYRKSVLEAQQKETDSDDNSAARGSGAVGGASTPPAQKKQSYRERMRSNASG